MVRPPHLFGEIERLVLEQLAAAAQNLFDGDGREVGRRPHVDDGDGTLGAHRRHLEADERGQHHLCGASDGGRDKAARPHGRGVRGSGAAGREQVESSVCTHLVRVLREEAQVGAARLRALVNR